MVHDMGSESFVARLMFAPDCGARLLLMVRVLS